MTKEMLRWLIVLSGIAQIVLILGSLAIPSVLKWKEELSGLKNLYRQMFWVYSGYIWGTNLSFGLVSAFAPHWLLDGSGLGIAVCGFIAVYWAARVLIQFLYFDTSELPSSAFHTFAEWALIALFIGLTAVYGGAVFFLLS